MKTSIRVIVLASFAAVLFASVPARAQSSHGLEVSEPKWRYLSVRESADYRPSFSSDRSSAGMSTLAVGTHEVSALFENRGAKTVKSVVWEYVFFKDTTQTAVKRKHTFRDSKRINPGEAVRPKHLLVTPRATGSVYDVVRIVRVEYEDGTVWRASKNGS